jgi:hypothetical protein
LRLGYRAQELVRHTLRKVSNGFTIEPLFRPGPIASNRNAYLRIPRSAEVSASENAGRANSRSAYFMSGAAVLGIWIP